DHYQLKRVVLDPVMVATSGDKLIADETVAVLVRELFPRVQLITPNLDEAGLLLGRPVPNEAALSLACADLQTMGAASVLLKGGHLQGEDVVDVLLLADASSLTLRSKRISSQNVHGTGCTLSSAIASHWALGLDLTEAVVQARSYILAAIQAGASVTTGRGHGPLNHGFAPETMHVLRHP
ncbi:MAG: hydroxymethylpyrimidine/phosphomethylpyrimidine kinase, partial [Burkholderiaceae bacterium]|nr:hydroxymethylpyrimidine/phosphomethylpyrimidine kinase [Burkholderiaceae bacterium]